MKRFLSGILLNVGMAIYILLAFWIIADNSIYWALGYVVIVLLSIFSITYSWCRKCSMRLCGCTHIWFGYLTKFYPELKPSAYTKKEQLGKYLYLIGIHFYPLPWLIKDLRFLILFYSLFMLTGLVEILLSCKKCNNKNCSLNKGFNESS